MISGVAVLIMAKTPRPGHCKTRLQPLLGADGCAQLQAALIRRTLLLAQQVAPTDTYLALDFPDDAVVTIPSGVHVLGQHGAHLGARLSHAAEEVLTDQASPVMVICTDALTLTAAHLHAAAARLDDGADVVFGPALDGGYYLIGMSQPHPELFIIEPGLWGGPKVLTASVAAARAADLRIALVDPLRDLDTPDDAAAFLREGDLEQDVAALLGAGARAR
ncbi:MAG: TIGR04282 family arsenosugar biosynthesis glycosyltransferase [Nakamurella sp.]